MPFVPSKTTNYLNRSLNCQRRRKKQASKQDGLEFHILTLAQNGSEGLSLFLTIAAAANELRKFVLLMGAIG